MDTLCSSSPAEAVEATIDYICRMLSVGALKTLLCEVI